MELTVDFISSLDGYATSEGWPGWWGLEGPEYLDWMGSQDPNGSLTLMGANTYRLMHGMAQEQSEGVDMLGKIDKIVFSNSLSDPLEWENTRLIRGDAVEAVRELKEQSGRPLATLGSLSLSRSLLEAGLVDRFRVVVFPVITGRTGHARLYDGFPDLLLELTESRTFDGSTQLLDYRPRVLDAPLPPGPGSAA
jgi:dihydrofolate reductase